MSNIYIQEPPTIGKVLLVTSVGDIDIELWSKEAPKACRNFVQLCIEGYYDSTIFHRVVKDFIVQGGDPTGTGQGGESIYGQPFKDEFHSRLRFTRRGLVAMANAGTNDNASQFFFTLAAAPELNNKHTIFGKVAGDTVYNMLKLSECEIGEDDRPVFPCKINKTEILSNPFNDIIPREIKRSKKEDKEEKKSKSKSKATKNFSLLSFGEEAEEDEEEVNQVTKDIRVKSKSSHDLVDDPQLSSVPVIETERRDSTKRPAEDSAEEDSTEESQEKKSSVDDVRKKLRKESDDKKLKKESAKKPEEKEEEVELSRSDELRLEAKKLKKEIKESRKKDEKPKEPEPMETEKSTEEPVSDAIAAYRQERQKYKDLRKDQKKKGSDREKATMLLLQKFQAKLDAARTVASTYSDDEAENKEAEKEADEESDDPSDLSWMKHKLQFDEKLNKVLDANITDVDRYEIFDPRNPMVQRRREESKKQEKTKKHRR